MRNTKSYGKTKHLHITGNLNSVVEKYQTQSIIFYLPAVGDSRNRLLNASRTCLVDKWLQAHPERAGKSSYRCWRLALVSRKLIYVKYLCPAYSLGNLVIIFRLHCN